MGRLVSSYVAVEVHQVWLPMASDRWTYSPVPFSKSAFEKTIESRVGLKDSLLVWV